MFNLPWLFEISFSILLTLSLPRSLSAGSLEELLLIENRVIEAKRYKLSSRRARDLTYEILARLESWLSYAELTPETTSSLIRVLSEARDLRKEILTRWDQSFLDLVDQTISKDICPKSLLKEVRILLSLIKTEELVLIQKTLKQEETKSSQGSQIGILAKTANWLSTIKPDRELTPYERAILTKIVADMQIAYDGSEPDWSNFLRRINSELNPKMSFSYLLQSRKLRPPVSSESLEWTIHSGIHTGEKLTNGLKIIGEQRLKANILDFIAENAVHSKAQVNRQWKTILSDYHRIKGYPFDQILKQTQSSGNIKNNLKISKHVEYDLFLKTIFQTIRKKPSEKFDEQYYYPFLHDLAKSLQSITSGLTKRSKLSRFCTEIIESVSTGQPSLSSRGRLILKRFEQLADDGNIYAQQIFFWITEFSLLGDKERQFFFPDRQLLELAKISPTPNIHWPENFPDYHLYQRWKKAIRLTSINSFPNDFSSYAALLRLINPSYTMFRRRQYGGFIEEKIERFQKHFVSSVDLRAGIEKELAQLSMEPSTVKFKNPNMELVFYNILQASIASEFTLFEGKNENIQNLILTYFRTCQKNSMNFIPSSLFKYKANFDVAGFLSLLISNSSCPPALMNHNFLSGPINFIQRAALLNWIGDGKQLGSSTLEDENKSVSTFDAIIETIDPKKIEVPENSSEHIDATKILNRLLQSTEVIGGIDLEIPSPFHFLSIIMHPQDYLCDRWMRNTRLSDLPTFSVQKFGWVLDYAMSLFHSNRKEFEKALPFFEKAERSWLDYQYAKDFSWLTRFAQSYFETNDFQNTVRILNHKKDLFNHIDHDFYVQSIRHLEDQERLKEAISSKQKFEREVLLPDLTAAAQIYEEDGDIGRAELIHAKIAVLSEKIEK